MNEKKWFEYKFQLIEEPNIHWRTSPLIFGIIYGILLIGMNVFVPEPNPQLGNQHGSVSRIILGSPFAVFSYEEIITTFCWWVFIGVLLSFSEILFVKILTGLFLIFFIYGYLFEIFVSTLKGEEILISEGYTNFYLFQKAPVLVSIWFIIFLFGQVIIWYIIIKYPTERIIK